MFYIILLCSHFATSKEAIPKLQAFKRLVLCYCVMCMPIRNVYTYLCSIDRYFDRCCNNYLCNRYYDF